MDKTDKLIFILIGIFTISLTINLFLGSAVT
jgi:hypothetical protein